MLAIDFLRREHDEIKLGLRVLHELAERLDAGLRVGQHALDHTVEFLAQYGDWSHHSKEEQILFPAATVSEAVAPALVKQLGEQHEIARHILDRLGVAGRDYVAGDRAAAVSISLLARRYVGHLFSHVEQEDRELYVPFEDRGPHADDSRLARELSESDDRRIGSGRADDLVKILHEVADEYLPESGRWKLSVREGLVP